MSEEVRTASVTILKTPSEVLKRALDFADLGLDTGETISSVGSISVDPPAELTCTGTPSSTMVILTLGAGVLNKNYKIVVPATTTGGQTIHGAVHVYIGNP